jgi:hypothetical protein
MLDSDLSSISMNLIAKDQERVISAPLPYPLSSSLPANRVLSVAVSDDEDVEWLWASAADGTSYVSGYNILKREPRCQS